MAVGLVIHEGSHIKLSDFQLLHDNLDTSGGSGDDSSNETMSDDDFEDLLDSVGNYVEVILMIDNYVLTL